MQAITIDSTLYADAQAYAGDRGMSVSSLVEKYLRRVLRERTTSKEKEHILKGFDHAIQEFKLVQEGKIQTRPAEDLLNEL